MRLRQGCEGAWLALLAAAVDRVTKLLVLRLAPKGALLLPGILRLKPVRNRGMAFSMLSGQGTLLIVVTLIVTAGVTGFLLARPEQPRLFRTGLWLIVGGSLGNLYDRLTLGAVIDFIEPLFVRFAVFNVADACICLGAALAMLSALITEAKGRKKGHGAGA